MWRRTLLVEFVKAYLPPMAQLLVLEEPYQSPAIVAGDLDGDGVPEVVAAYRWQRKCYAIVLKEYYNLWYIAAIIEGEGDDINCLKIAPIANAKNNNLIIGWQIGAALAKLYIYEWINVRFRLLKLLPVLSKTTSGIKWGYVNTSGEFVINPKYSYAEEFQQNGLAVVSKDSLLGIIDEQGNYVAEPKYQVITNFSEGLAAAADDKGYYIIDEKGREITTKPYTIIGKFQNGRVAFAITNPDGKWVYGYLDRQGKEIIPAKYQFGEDFKEGKALVQTKDGEYVLIGLNGENLKVYKYSLVDLRSEGLLAFKKDTEGKFGFIDENGEVIIQPQYTGVQAFRDGRAAVNIAEDYGNEYGLIDRNGNFVIRPEYNDINPLGEDRIAVGKAIDKNKPYMGSKYSIADTRGSLLTDFVYCGISDYDNGLASAYDAKNTFFIDMDGKLVKSLPILSGRGMISFTNGLIKANIDYRLSYLDRQGRLIWRQNTVIPLDEQYKVIEEKFKPNKDYLVYYPQIYGMKDKEVESSVNNKLKEMSQLKPISEDVQLEYNYFSDFSVEFFKKDLLVLELNSYEYYFGAAHGMPTKVYAHVNLVNGRFYELKDLFKANSNYVEILSDIIENQIKINEEYSYVWLDQYKGIKENQPFYVDHEALYVYFNPYDIAPYAAGFPTFKILFSDRMSIINVEGDFWKSFN